MPAGLAIPAIMTGVSAVGGALSGRKSANTTTYNDPKEYIPLRDRLIKYNMDRLNSPTALPPGYIEGGIQNINRGSDAVKANLENLLTARGLSNSPAAVPALLKQEMNRQGAINKFENIDAPAYEQNLRQLDYSNAAQLFGMRNPSVTGPNTATGGAFNNASEMLAFLYGSGAFGKR